MEFFLSQNYNEFEKFYQDAYRWNLDFRKLGLESFEGYIGLIDQGDVQVGKIQLNDRIEQEGMSPKGFRTFVIPGDNQQGFHWRRHEVGNRDLMIFPKQGELEAVSFGNFFHYMISVEETYLYNFLEENSLNMLRLILQSGDEVIRLNRGYFLNLQTFLEVLFLRIEVRTYLIHSQSFQFLVKERLLMMLLDLDDRKLEVQSKARNRRRDLVLIRVWRFLEIRN